MLLCSTRSKADKINAIKMANCLCDTPSTGFARWAEHSGWVIGTYMAAFLPWALMQTIDLISHRWRTIFATRLYGYGFLIVSIIGLGLVLFYLVLQRQAQDYKEMAAGLVALALCLYNVLRSIYGLMQLHAFKSWNVRALKCIVQLDYPLPVDVIHFSLDDDDGKYRRKTFDDIIEHNCKVNNTVIDNELYGAELPCRFDLLNQENWSRFFKNGNIEELLKSPHLEECTVKWTVAFLCKFGRGWLQDCSMIGCPRDSWDDWQNALSRNLGVFCAKHVTRNCVSEEQKSSEDELISLITPVHWMRSHSYSEGTQKTKYLSSKALPYSSKEGTYLRFNNYLPTIKKAISNWDTRELNHLRRLERNALNTMKPNQIASFLELMHRDNWYGREYKGRKFEENYTTSWDKRDTRVRTLIRQLGFDENSEKEPGKYKNNQKLSMQLLSKLRGLLGDENDDYDRKKNQIQNEVTSPITLLLSGLPFGKEMVSHVLWAGQNRPNRLVLQVSVHVDNWIALECGNSFNCLKYEPSEEDSVFQKQKLMEIARRNYELSMSKDNFPQTKHMASFIGCVMESTRSLLAWYCKGDKFLDDTKWSFPVLKDSVTLLASKQLIDCLIKHATQGDSKSARINKSLQMRILWELQFRTREYITIQNDLGPQSIAVMMLCILGFPSMNLICGQKHRTMSIKVEAVNAPQKIFIHVTLDLSNDKSKEFNLKLVSLARSQKFEWQEWRDAFEGRMVAQHDWRREIELTKSEIFKPITSSGPINTRTIEEDTMTDEAKIKFNLWPGWKPHFCEISEYELMNSENIFYTSTTYQKASPLDLEYASERLRTWLKNGISSISGAITYLRHMLTDVEMSKLDKLKESICGMSDDEIRSEKGLGDLQFLEQYVATILKSDTAHDPNYVQNSFQKLADAANEIYQHKSHEYALLIKAKALFHIDKSKAAESLRVLASKCSRWKYTEQGFKTRVVAHIYLAVYYLTLPSSDIHTKFAKKHLESYAMLIYDCEIPIALSIARLFEDGCLFGRDLHENCPLYKVTNVNSSPDIGVEKELNEVLNADISIAGIEPYLPKIKTSKDRVTEIEKLIEDKSNRRGLKDVGVAKKIYRKIALISRERSVVSKNDYRYIEEARSRFFLLDRNIISVDSRIESEDGNGDGEFEEDMTEKLRSIYCDENEKAVELAIENRFDEAIEWLDGSISCISSLSNLAVILETNSNKCKTKREAVDVYEKLLKHYREDNELVTKNPAAMYNLATYLKWGKKNSNMLRNAKGEAKEILDKLRKNVNKLFPLKHLLAEVTRIAEIIEVEESSRGQRLSYDHLEPTRFWQKNYDIIEGKPVLIKTLDQIASSTISHEVIMISNIL